MRSQGGGGTLNVLDGGFATDNFKPLLYTISSAAFCNFTSRLNPLRPNNDLSQTSHFNIKGLLVRS